MLTEAAQCKEPGNGLARWLADGGGVRMFCKRAQLPQAVIAEAPAACCLRHLRQQLSGVGDGVWVLSDEQASVLVTTALTLTSTHRYPDSFTSQNASVHNRKHRLSSHRAYSAPSTSPLTTIMASSSLDDAVHILGTRSCSGMVQHR